MERYTMLEFYVHQGTKQADMELPKTPKLACGWFKDWLRQRSPWLADIWRLRRILKPGMKYGL